MGVGKVYIIGAGPGSPDLITLRGLRALRQADVVIADGLVPRTYLDRLGVAADHKTIRWLGDGDERRSQAEINELMLRAATEARVVARLKCGDPFVFGRGGEEIDFLDEHGVPWEVIPGLSACIAAPSNAALPLTDRRQGSSFAAVTARCSGGGLNPRFPRADSLVVFMGVAVLEEVARQLVREGWAPGTPAAVIERATLPWEQRVTGPLERIAKAAAEHNVRSPAVLLVGAVASHRDARPRILYTGLDPTNFRALGDVIHWPALRVVPDEDGRRSLPAALSGLQGARFDWIIFSSRVGVQSFFAELETHGLDARVLAACRIAVVGAGTELLLREHGVRADVVPREPGSLGLLERIPYGTAGVLLVQGTHAPASLQDELSRRGCRVARLALHRVEPNPELGRPLPQHDVIYFTSPSGVRAYWDTYGGPAFEGEVWSIGDVTLRQIKELGFDGKVVSPHVPRDENATVAAV